ncbi:cationic amino acid transporter 9 chloroplastic-like, partial [Trifolium medium]|nr:cationic amino acid transporter 9 chloroplastic-like [Trifolium medium]
MPHATGYSVVSACVVVLRWKDRTNSQVSSPAKRREGIIFLITVAASGFAAGLFFHYKASIFFVIAAIVVAV